MLDNTLARINMKAALFRVPEDEELISFLKNYARKNNVGKAFVSGIGAFKSATLAYYDIESQRYEPIEIGTRAEVVALSGNISLLNREPLPHIHAVLSMRDGSTVGGHLIRGTVFLLELFVFEFPGEALERKPWKYGLTAWDV